MLSIFQYFANLIKLVKLGFQFSDNKVFLCNEMNIYENQQAILQAYTYSLISNGSKWIKAPLFSAIYQYLCFWEILDPGGSIS